MINLITIMFILSSKTFADVSVQGIPPATSLSYSFIEVANSNRVRGYVLGPGAYFINFQYSFIDEPLVSVDAEGKKSVLIDSLSTIDFRTGTLINERLRASVNFSVNNISIDKNHSFSLGDSFVQFNYRLSDLSENIQYSIIPELILPTGNSNKYLSGGFGGGFRFAAQYQFSFAKFAANIGYKYRPKSKWRSLDYSSLLIAGIGLEIPIKDQFSLNIEGIAYPSIPYKDRNTEGEIYLGGTFELRKTTTFRAGISYSGYNSNLNQSPRFTLSMNHYFLDQEEKKAVEVKEKQCRIEPFNVTYHSRPLIENELREKSLILPYKSDVSAFSNGKFKSIKTIKYGEVTDITNKGLSYVKDSQIPFAIEIYNLPEFESIKEINYARLKMFVNKLSTEKYLDTEFICSMDFKVCSGEPISKKNWENSVEKDYFPNWPRGHNKNFSSKYLSNSLDTVGKETLYTSQITLSAKELLAGSAFSQKDLLNKAFRDKILYFVIGDDTLPINDITFELSLGVERCY